MSEGDRPIAAGDALSGVTRGFLGGRELRILTLLIFGCASVAGFLLHRFDRFSFYYFGDASSHIMKAREFTDSLNLQFLYLGTTWLPLPHLLLLPFAAVDAFFFSGVAGVFVGIPCLVGTGIFLFLLVREVSDSPSAAFVMAALFSLNPNVVYMAFTPMDEPSLVFFVALSAFGLFRWLQSRSRRMLLLSASGALLASLCRYEAWMLAPMILICAALYAIPQWRNGRKGEGIVSMVISLVSILGIALWVFWHWAKFGSPLKFTQGTYSALPEYYRHSEERLPLNILKTYGRAILNIFGPVLLALAVWGIARLRKKPGARSRSIFLLFLLAPLLFTLTATLAGYVGVDEWWWNWRYALPLGLFLSAAGGLGLADIYRSGSHPIAAGLVTAGLLAMPFVQLLDPDVNVATYRDAAKCISPAIADGIHFAERISGYYRGGSIALMTEDGPADKMKIASGIPIRYYHTIRFPFGYRVPDSLLAADSYLLMEKNKAREPWTLPPDSLIPSDLYPRGFERVVEDSCFALLRRSDTPFPPTSSGERIALLGRE